MFIHPDSLHHNPVEQFPEIFEKYEFINFQLPGDRMMDFFDSSMFLFGSQRNQDVNMIFSGVQRLSTERYVDFQSYLKKKSVSSRLLNIGDIKVMQKEIGKICEEYNASFGMRRLIINFYQKYVINEDKGFINSKISKPAWYKPERGHTRDGGFEMVIDLLLQQRNDLDHGARYTPFFDGRFPYTHKIKMKSGKKEVDFTSNLKFQEFYEVTRKAVAKFWFEEYEQYLQNGGREKIAEMVSSLKEQIKQINEEQRKLANKSAS